MGNKHSGLDPAINNLSQSTQCFRNKEGRGCKYDLAVELKYQQPFVRIGDSAFKTDQHQNTHFYTSSPQAETETHNTRALRPQTLALFSSSNVSLSVAHTLSVPNASLSVPHTLSVHFFSPH